MLAKIQINKNKLRVAMGNERDYKNAVDALTGAVAKLNIQIREDYPNEADLDIILEFVGDD